MPRYSSASLYEDTIKISFRELRKWGYFKKDSFKSGTLTWSRLGNSFVSINIAVCIREEPHVTLSYNYGGEPRKYDISLVSLPSNLGKGKVWYFLCPHTGKRCRVLYSIEGYFLHREAPSSRIYESQTRSQFSRAMDKVFHPPYGKQKIHDELNRPYFKTHYAGRPISDTYGFYKERDTWTDYRLWIDHHGDTKEPPLAFYCAVDLLEKHYGVFFNTETWRWERV